MPWHVAVYMLMVSRPGWIARLNQVKVHGYIYDDLCGSGRVMDRD